MHKKKNQKNIYYAKMLSTNWLMIVIAILLFIMIFAFIYLNDQISYQRSVDRNIQVQIDNLKSSSTLSSDDSLLIEYYRELSNKTDEAINRVLVTVGLITGIITIFSVLFAFKAPHDIDKRIEEIKKELLSAQEAAEEAKYHAEIASALTEETTQKRITALTRVIKKYPKKPEAYNYRGYQYTKKELYDDALDDFQSSLRFGIKREIFDNNSGVIYRKKGDDQKAIVCFNQIIQSGQNEYIESAYINRGQSYENIGDNKQALSDYNECLLINPKNVNAYADRARLYYILSKKELDPQKKSEYINYAKTDIDKASKLDPEDKSVSDIKSAIYAV